MIGVDGIYRTHAYLASHSAWREVLFITGGIFAASQECVSLFFFIIFGALLLLEVVSLSSPGWNVLPFYLFTCLCHQQDEFAVRLDREVRQKQQQDHANRRENAFVEALRLVMMAIRV